MIDPQVELDAARSKRPLEIHRMLPQDENAEEAVIGAFLIAPREVFRICSDKGATNVLFQNPRNAIFFDLLMEFCKDNEPWDFAIMVKCLRGRGQLDMFGTNGSWITHMWTVSPTAANVGHHLEILQEMSVFREVIKTCTKYCGKGYEQQEDVYGLVNSLLTETGGIMKLLEGSRTHNRDMKQLVTMALDDFEADLAKKGVLDMPTGIHALDYYTDGLVAPEITVILGKPSDFKTALALNISEHLACEHKKRVGIISLEMGDTQLVKRLIFSRAKVDIRKIKRRKEVLPEEGVAIVKAGQDLSEAPIFIRDDGGMTIAEIDATATGWKAKHGLDFLVIDHAQLAKGTKKANSRTEEVEEVSNALKPMAKRLGIPIMILSQVTEDEKKGAYSAKQSRALEQDADNIWALRHDRDSNDKITTSWITIGKQRDRERNVVVPISVFPETQRITDRVKEHEPEIVDAYVNKPKKGR